MVSVISSLNIKVILSVFFAFTLVACANSSLFLPYPQQAKTYQQAMNSGLLEAAIKEAYAKQGGKNKTLHLLEGARLNQADKNFEESRNLINGAINEFNKVDDSAVISAKKSSSFIGSLVTNDNAFKYEASGYERVFAHHFQSMNYLALDDKQGALVEIRRANIEQNVALERHHKELVKAEEQAEKEKSNISKDSLESERFASLNNAAAKVKNSFQNAYTFYYSGIIQESIGEINDAYIDYKKALEIFPDNVYLQRDVLRLAKALHFFDDYNKFSNQFSAASKGEEKNDGTLVVLYEQGFVPAKVEIFLPIQTFESIHSFAIPTYAEIWQPSTSLKISNDIDTIGNTALIADIHAMAAKALQEKTYSRLVRQALRANAKARLQQQAREDGGAIGGFFATAYAAVSERADLRSWLTLPSNAQIFRSSLNSGSHSIHFSNSRINKSLDVKINQGRITLVRIITTEGKQPYIEQYEL